MPIVFIYGSNFSPATDETELVSPEESKVFFLRL
jgi:hypothetical protein